MFDRTKTISIFINIICIPLMLLFLYLWIFKKCPPCNDAGKTIITHDTIPVVIHYKKPDIVHVPEPTKVIKIKKPHSVSIVNNRADTPITDTPIQETDRTNNDSNEVAY